MFDRNNLPQYHMFPMPMVTTTQLPPPNNDRLFKYKVGDRFYDPDCGDMIEITGFNYELKTYKGTVEYHLGGNATHLKSNMIYESRLDRMVFYDSNKNEKEEAVNYRIYYFDNKKKESRATQYDVTLTNIRALAKMLNSLVRRGKRIVLVSIIDDNGKYVNSVKFLKKEIDEQKFLTGLKERLLAHAKYECGYEIATNF